MIQPGTTDPGRDEDKWRHANSFGGAAQSYDRARPSYPIEAVRWLIPENAHWVIDLGAGTGKLTRIISGLVGDVVAVEPSAGMREQFARTLPSLRILDGTAEQIPLPDRFADAVVVGQAWHWVDPGRAVPEVARVLRPSGLLGLIWNTRDERVGWVAELGRLLARRGSGFTDIENPVVGAPFSAPERCEFLWNQTMTPARLLDLVESRSYVLLLPDDQRADLRRQVGELLTDHPDLAGRTHFDLPYLSECWRYRLED